MIVTSLPQVLRQHDHSVSSRVLQSFWSKFHRWRPLSLSRWRSQQHFQLLWQTLLWLLHGQARTTLQSNVPMRNKDLINLTPTFSSRTCYRTAILVEMVILTALVSTLSLTSGLGKVSYQFIWFKHFLSHPISSTYLIPFFADWFCPLDLGDLWNIPGNLLNPACGHNSDFWTQVSEWWWHQQNKVDMIVTLTNLNKP